MPTNWTPLRYPGGKSRLTRYLTHLLKENNLLGCSYYEPFAGGAGAAVNLLRRGYVSEIVLNDIDPGIYAFWHAALHDTDALCSLIVDSPLSIEEWQIQRSISRHPSDHSLTSLGFAVLYMNRTNRSGIIRGGVIGGQRQAGKWKIDARFNREGLTKRIQEIAKCKDRISLYNMDALEFIAQSVPTQRENLFLYIDPPYYRKGQALYENHYKHDDHSKFAKQLAKGIKAPWLVSYDNTPEICSIYKGHTRLSYGINYSAASRYEGKEVLFFGPGLKPPAQEDPFAIKNYACGDFYTGRSRPSE